MQLDRCDGKIIDRVVKIILKVEFSSFICLKRSVERLFCSVLTKKGSEEGLIIKRSKEI